MRSFKSKSDSMSLLLPAVRKRGRNHVRTVPDSSEWKLGGGEPMFKEAESRCLAHTCGLQGKQQRPDQFMLRNETGRHLRVN
jgi:hypothetical protein